jgi:hypothetical protein
MLVTGGTIVVGQSLKRYDSSNGTKWSVGLIDSVQVMGNIVELLFQNGDIK